MQKPLVIFFAGLGLLGAGSHGAPAAPPPSPTIHVRGTVQALTAQTLTVATAAGPVRVRLARPFQVLTLVPSDRARIKSGSFLGITSVTGPDGSQRAVEVHIFPERMRGAGEGSRAWDLPGPAGAHRAAAHSKMTNGTVSRSRPAAGPASRSRMTNGTVRRQAGGSALTLRYRNGATTGTQTIILPPGIPIVTFAPGRPQDLRAGAHVFILAVRKPDGTLTASRALVGRNGLVPPM